MRILECRLASKLTPQPLEVSINVDAILYVSWERRSPTLEPLATFHMQGGEALDSLTSWNEWCDVLGTDK